MKVTCQSFFFFILISSFLFVFSSSNLARGGEILSVKEGDQALNFTLKDLNGHKISLTDYKGKPILILFMTTWIRDSWKMIPHMKRNYSLYNSQGLVLFNIDIMEPREKAEQFARRHDIPYPTLLDKNGEVSNKYGISSVPILVLINRDGRIACWNCLDFADLLEEQFRLKK